MQTTELASALDNAIKKMDEANTEFVKARYAYLKSIGLNPGNFAKLIADGCEYPILHSEVVSSSEIVVTLYFKGSRTTGTYFPHNPMQSRIIPVK